QDGRPYRWSRCGSGSSEPTGVGDRGTSPRQSRELGRSSGLFHGWEEGGTTGTPGGSPMVQRKSDVPIGGRKWGNAHGAKGDTCRRPFDGHVNHTQRWRDGDYRSRADSPAGSPGPAHAIHVADAPLHSGYPAHMLRVGGWQASDRSRWGDESDVWAASRGQPSGAAPETAPEGVPAPAGTPGGDPQGRWPYPSLGDKLLGRQDRPGNGSPYSGSDL